MIDTHSHIYAKEFDQDRDEIIQRAKDAGVSGIFLPNIDVASIQRMHETEEKYSGFCKAMMGLHPTSVKEDYKEQLKQIEKHLNQRPYSGVGEIGMDLYWDTTFRKEQEDALNRQINWSRELNLPVVIHTRDAFPEIFSVFDKAYDPQLKGIFHSFSGSLEDAKHILSMPGFYLGINGVVTFKKSNLPEILVEIGYEKLVLETDAPYLAPVPYRGKRNEPAYLTNVINKLSEIFNVSIETLKETTTKNAIDLFGKID
ncbi:TatD family hydrolase [Alkalitalea saponilacus]|uniref:TatD DNase family protein n=1 Tax=Alkalitalea saponilacus TaxID=889453 RepID=A0A1T5BXK5_9BACT|nr:TatD family hydrolase [Alkalitalea saponilacus]ASB49558.1 hydrolase TatD [Alkalitalea saponilacus]SKB51874.1 TatD DNase family protein [Alkalitalea saponilacus]